jgi:hypothetical protein
MFDADQNRGLQPSEANKERERCEMKRIVLAIATFAMGITGTGRAVHAQSLPQPDYSLYGGPPASHSQSQRHGVQTPSLGPLYKMYGVPDEITAADQAREARRNAAVEFGMFRRQFTGSTEFWMDHDRTRLAKVRYSMDEPMWRSIHSAYDFGDGGYMYNTAASAYGPQWAGTRARVTVTAPENNVYQNSFVGTNVVPPAPLIRHAPAVPASPAVGPTHRPSAPAAPLVAGGPESNPAPGR